MLQRWTEGEGKEEEGKDREGNRENLYYLLRKRKE
jgi:hypothetical protein